MQLELVQNLWSLETSLYEVLGSAVGKFEGYESPVTPCSSVPTYRTTNNIFQKSAMFPSSDYKTEHDLEIGLIVLSEHNVQHCGNENKQ
jgi:hypothetical protein